MKAVLFNGGREGNGTLKTVQDIVSEELAGGGWSVDTFVLGKIKIEACLGCFGCWLKTPGICVIDDAGREVTRAFVQSDLAVFFTPVTFGGYSSELKKAVDRLIPAISPYFVKINGETHHKPRYERYPWVAAIGVLPGHDAESEGIFRKVVERNAINIHSPAHASCIVLEEDRPDQMRDKIRKCLGELEVMR